MFKQINITFIKSRSLSQFTIRAFKMVERGHVWTILKAVLFGILLIIYCLVYMKPALVQYGKKRTTIAQMREDINEFESPMFVACPDPPFKASFFKNIGINSSGAEKYFWAMPMYQKMLENPTSSAIDLFMNMTYRLGPDWQIYFLYQCGLVYLLIYFEW